ncbi:hypothetical protein D3C81_1887520 [compost metagenome]
MLNRSGVVALSVLHHVEFVARTDDDISLLGNQGVINSCFVYRFPSVSTVVQLKNNFNPMLFRILDGLEYSFSGRTLCKRRTRNQQRLRFLNIVLIDLFRSQI